MRDPRVLRRDAAIRRLRRAKQSIATLSVVGAGMVATAAAHTFPGHRTVTSATVVRSAAPAARRSAGAARARSQRPVATRRPRRPRPHATATTAATTPASAPATTAAPAPATVTTTSPPATATAPAPAPPTTAVVTSGGS